MIQAGTVVRVLAPFDETFAETYTVSAIILDDNGEASAYLLEGIESAFSHVYLEVIDGNHNP